MLACVHPLCFIYPSGFSWFAGTALSVISDGEWRVVCDRHTTEHEGDEQLCFCPDLGRRQWLPVGELSGTYPTGSIAVYQPPATPSAPYLEFLRQLESLYPVNLVEDVLDPHQLRHLDELMVFGFYEKPDVTEPDVFKHFEAVSIPALFVNASSRPGEYLMRAAGDVPGGWTGSALFWPVFTAYRGAPVCLVGFCAGRAMGADGVFFGVERLLMTLS